MTDEGDNYQFLTGGSSMEVEAAVGVMLIIIILYIAIYAIMIAVSIAAYVLNSLGMYTIAKRRNISNPIFAWIPVANVWLLGAIADDYDEKVKGVKKKSRVLLLSLYLAFCAAFVLLIVGVVVFAIVGATQYYAEETVVAGMIIIMMVGYLAIFAVAIVMSVFQYIAYYKLFKSCHPDNAVVYLILSIFISMALPIIIFICRKDDKGLPTEDAVVA